MFARSWRVVAPVSFILFFLSLATTLYARYTLHQRALAVGAVNKWGWIPQAEFEGRTTLIVLLAAGIIGNFVFIITFAVAMRNRPRDLDTPRPDKKP